MAEYGWSIEYTLAVRLDRGFALYAAIKARYGVEETAPSFEDLELLEQLEAVREQLKPRRRRARRPERRLNQRTGKKRGRRAK